MPLTKEHKLSKNRTWGFNNIMHWTWYVLSNPFVDNVKKTDLIVVRQDKTNLRLMMFVVSPWENSSINHEAANLGLSALQSKVFNSTCPLLFFVIIMISCTIPKEYHRGVFYFFYVSVQRPDHFPEIPPRAFQCSLKRGIKIERMGHSIGGYLPISFPLQILG